MGDKDHEPTLCVEIIVDDKLIDPKLFSTGRIVGKLSDPMVEYDLRRIGKYNGEHPDLKDQIIPQIEFLVD